MKMKIGGIRLYLFLTILLLSLWWLISPAFVSSQGVVVVTEGDKCTNINPGDTVTRVDKTDVNNVLEYNQVLNNVKMGEYYPVVVNGGPGGCVAVGDGDLGMVVSDLKTGGLKYGPDISGGIVITLEPEGELNVFEMSALENVLEKRIENLNLRETSAELDGGSIKISSINTENIGLLTMRGLFEARIAQAIRLQNGVGIIALGNDNYDITLVNSSLQAGGDVVEMNGYFTLGDVNFHFINYTNTTVAVEALFMDNSDVTEVFKQMTSIAYDQASRTYRYDVPIGVGEDASRRFTKIIKGLAIETVGTQQVLSGRLRYYIDGNVISDLTIPPDFGGEGISSIIIIGFTTNNDAAETGMKRALAAASGKLPSGLSIVNIEETDPRFPNIEFYMFGALAAIVLIGGVAVAVSSKKVVLAALSVSLTGGVIVSVLGLASLLQNTFGISWLIDVYSMAGLVVFTIASVLKMRHLSSGRRTDKLKRVRIALWVVGFIIIFTPFRGLGLSLLVGLVLEKLLTVEVFKSAARTVE